MIQLDDNKKVPLYEQLYREIKKKILAGEYETDYQLQPIRVFAKELNISHNTVNRAYQQLLAEGYIRATQGSGFYVEEIYTTMGIKKKILDRTDKFLIEAQLPHYEIKYDFSRANYANEGFSWGKWARYVQNAIVDSAYKSMISECPNKGSRELREEICKYIKANRGVVCTADQIIICPTSEHGMEIIMNVLPEAEYKVGIEEPSSEKMRRLMISKGYQMQPIPTNANGMDVNYLEKTDCNLLYTTPSFQFPTGVTLPLVKRIQLLEWCRRNKIYCIENDYENEYLFGSQPIMSMQSMDNNGRVIYIGTFSNVLTPELKFSFVVLPKSLLQSYEEKYEYYRAYMPEYEQRAFTQYIADGNLERQSRRCAIINQRKKDIFFDFVNENMRDIMKCYSGASGTHCLVEIFGCRDAGVMIKKLKYHGIQIYSTKEYWYEKDHAPENVFMISFSCIQEKNVEKACMFFEQELRSILGIGRP